eukprot:30716-Pelagococcus_subviridis.AAC.7
MRARRPADASAQPRADERAPVAAHRASRAEVRPSRQVVRDDDVPELAALAVRAERARARRARRAVRDVRADARVGSRRVRPPAPTSVVDAGVARERDAAVVELPVRAVR